MSDCLPVSICLCQSVCLCQGMYGEVEGAARVAVVHRWHQLHRHRSHTGMYCCYRTLPATVTCSFLVICVMCMTCVSLCCAVLDVLVRVIVAICKPPTLSHMEN